MSRRSALLELAILGLLHESPLHGYELRKRLNAGLGAFRVISYGTLYPCLRELVTRGWIAEDAAAKGLPEPLSGTTGSGSRRGRIVYVLTDDGLGQFQSMLSQSGPAAWEDDTFSVHFSFFARTESEVRLRILEGRRSRLEQRLDAFRDAAAQRRERLDLYTTELQRHGLESVEREVRWLSELIETERLTAPAAEPAATPGPAAATAPFIAADDSGPAAVGAPAHSVSATESPRATPGAAIPTRTKAKVVSPAVVTPAPGLEAP